jgi:hypothetical protein
VSGARYPDIKFRSVYEREGVAQSTP